MEEAHEVMDYPMEKQKLFRKNAKGEDLDVGVFSIVRTDLDVTLVPSVGSRFVAQSNSHMLNVIDEFILASYQDLEIESVGTLWGGATAFVNLKLGEFVVRGDTSLNVTNLMYANPLGKGSYLACAHTTRIVCNNTLRAAAAQGAANQTLKKFRHTKTATEKIRDHIIDLAEVKMELTSFVAQLDNLADQKVNSVYLDRFLNEFFPVAEEGRAQTMAENAREKLTTVFESKQEMRGASDTKYAILNAFTDYTDHLAISRKNTDDGAIMWDGLNGVRAADKDKVFDWLISN
jgi:phage/plasmid-like protein (TIGR03299 family)